MGESPPSPKPWISVAIDLAGGTVGGMALAIVGQPMDLVKSRMQMAESPFKTVIHCVKHTWAHEGMKGFFKGLSPPLAMTGYTNAVLFSANGIMQRLIRQFAGMPESAPLSAGQVLISTWLTAPVYVFVLTPIEVLKVRLQVASVAGVHLNGPIQCAKILYQDEGLKGFFRGFVPTLLSRLVGLPFYIGGYWLARRSIQSMREESIASFSTTLVAGGLAGIAFWSANYPLDLLKTRYQQPSQANVKPSIIKTFRSLMSERGFRGLYRGFSACLIRAFPANAAQFSANELTTRHLRTRFLE